MKRTEIDLIGGCDNARITGDAIIGSSTTTGCDVRRVAAVLYATI